MASVTDGPADPVLERLERYCDAAPRSGARTESIGPFTLFVSTGMWPYYARPSLGLDRDLVPEDVSRVRDRQTELGVPHTFEWIVETAPSVTAAARGAGLSAHELPLLQLRRSVPAPTPPGVRIRRVPADDPDLPRILAVSSVAFAHAGTSIGPAGPVERDQRVAQDPPISPRLRARIEKGLMVLYVAEDRDGPIASGGHQPLEGVTEVVGVATLPFARRRGLGAAITAALVDDALAGGKRTVFLSASGDAVARVYERLGFERVGHAGLAEPDRDGRHA